MAVKLYILIGAVVALLLLGCGAAGQPTPAAPFRGPQDVKGAPGSATFSLVPSPSSASASPDRLIVRTVNFNIVVKDVAATLESVASLATGLGGFVLSSQISGEEGTRYGSISIRVPVEQTDAALAKLRALAVRVESERSAAQDVTEEYVDLQARLKNLENTNEQYLTLLRRAQTVEDTLKVQQELSSAQGQIEQLKGRMQYLERTSATSLINVDVRPASSPKALVEPGWSAWETAKDALRGLVSFGQGLVDVAIRLGIFAPVWVPLAVLTWFLARWLAHKARRG